MKAWGVSLLWAAAAMALPAQTFTTLYSFCAQTACADGASPYAGLVQATNGNFYGTTAIDGGGAGTVFRITPSGTLTTLHSFDGADGIAPVAGLVQATNGKFYGTTQQGGVDGLGTVFKITAGGTLTMLYSFCAQNGCADGASPYAGLVQGTNGNLYGTTSHGGGANGGGTVFKITPSGTLATLHSFAGYPTDGANPQAGLVQATNGKLYGTTSSGGANGGGTIFKITPSGTLTTLHSFDNTDGANPQAGLVQAADGDFYGTTEYGGVSGWGTVFKITPSGTLTTLHSFNIADGELPVAGLVQATNGKLYGTTSSGGANGGGTVFKITPSGTLTTLYSFCMQSNCADGSGPQGALVQGTNGTFYGTTRTGGATNVSYCGSSGCGTVFSLSVGLGPFVETQPTSGAVGAPVTILGTNLTGSTSVTFDSIAAAFTVVSASEITTTVPTGATTGTVQVVTPGGTLSSNVPFRVTP
jgi:uncharacterized repeat protein (TIGR03803 family)